MPYHLAVGGPFHPIAKADVLTLARAEVDTALRVLLDRLPKLRLVDDPGVRITGSFVQLLQGPNRLPVRFD